MILEDDYIPSDHPLVKKHFHLSEEIIKNYRKRKQDPEALEKAISACKKQILIASKVSEIFKKDEDILNDDGSFCLGHGGFEQLAIIYEKQGKFETRRLYIVLSFRTNKIEN